MFTRCKCGAIASTMRPCRKCNRVSTMKHEHHPDPEDEQNVYHHAHPHDGKWHSHPHGTAYIILPCGHSQRCIYREAKLRNREAIQCRICGETYNVRPEDQPDYVYPTGAA